MPSSNEPVLAHFCKCSPSTPTTLEQPLPNTWTLDGVFPCFHIKITTITIWTFKTVRPVIKWRQKCCFARRNSCFLASSLTYRWLKLLSFLIRYKGNQYPPIFNTTNRFLPAHAYRLVLIGHGFQKLLERVIGREKKAIKKQDVTWLAQLLLHFFPQSKKNWMIINILNSP